MFTKLSVDIREELKKVIDPEINHNIVDLGLIYEVKVKDKHVEVLMTLTTPMCPAGGYLMHEVERVITELGYTCEVELTFDPPWNPDMI
ncbi:MAG: DUF59 domain-containing protein, partial [Candidatus Altiarchaeota archaeon]|nr:DUF59 domain-containing protein [Candidatus Altiarchaeota archaeon]